MSRSEVNSQKQTREPPEAPALYQTYAETEKRRLEQYIAVQDKRIEDCSNLIKRLEDLPKKISYDAMLPICSVGFFHGRIVSTNEITLSIGDNYFIECSAHEAVQTLKRRIQAIKDAKATAQKSFELATRNEEFFKNVYGQNESGEREVEIREEYDEEKEKQFREKRKAPKTSVLYHFSSPSSTSEIKTHEDAIKRLEILELQEKENEEWTPEDELYKYKVKDQGFEPPKGISKKDFAALLERLETTSSESESSFDEEDEEVAEKNREIKEIEEKKETIEKAGKSEDLDSDDLPEPEEERKEKSSPKKKAKERRRVRFSSSTADSSDGKVAEKEAATKSKPHSILRSTQPTPIDYEALSSMEKEPSAPRILPGSTAAFSGQVIERIVPGPLSHTNSKEEPENQPAISKPMSKFKSSRATKSVPK